MTPKQFSAFVERERLLAIRKAGDLVLFGMVISKADGKFLWVNAAHRQFTATAQWLASRKAKIVAFVGVLPSGAQFIDLGKHTAMQARVEAIARSIAAERASITKQRLAIEF